MKNKILIFDIEGNGLLDTLTDIWMIICQEVGSEEQVVFSDHAKGARPLEEAEAFMKEYKSIGGHNVFGYDLPALYQTCLLYTSPSPRD